MRRKSKADYRVQARLVREVPCFGVADDGDVFNWYNHYYDADRAWQSIITWFKNSRFKNAAQLAKLIANNKRFVCDRITSTDWTIADQINQGIDVSDPMTQRFIERMKKLVLQCKNKPSSVIKTTTVVHKDNDKLINLEQQLDQAYLSIRRMMKPKFDYAAFCLANNITTSDQEQIVSIYTPQLQEIEQAIRGRVEGYENFKPAQLKAMHSVFQSICYEAVAKKSSASGDNTEKPKKKATKKGSAAVRAVEDQSCAVFYSSAVSKMVIVVAQSGKTLSVKGNKIINFDDAKSFMQRYDVGPKSLSMIKKMPFDNVVKWVGSANGRRSTFNGRLPETSIRLI